MIDYASILLTDKNVGFVLHFVLQAVDRGRRRRIGFCRCVVWSFACESSFRPPGGAPSRTCSNMPAAGRAMPHS